MITRDTLIPADHETCIVPVSGVVEPSLNTATHKCMGVYIGGDGNLVLNINGHAATYAVSKGQTVIGHVQSVDHTTTATGLVFLYLGA